MFWKKKEKTEEKNNSKLEETKTKAKELITHARIALQKDQPFWAYGLLHLVMHEDDGRLPYPTMGVDPEGNIYYSPEFVASLTLEECQGVLAHELGHIIFLISQRLGNRDPHLANICHDLNVNDLLTQSGFVLPQFKSGPLKGKGKCLIPTNHSFTFKLEKGDYTVRDIHKKQFEVIYDELYDKLPKREVEAYAGEGFDSHLPGQKKTKSEMEALAKKWKQIAQEAATLAKMRGNLPAHLQRFVDGLYDSKINWRSLLYKYISSQIAFDVSWARPHNRSHALGTYLPRTIKESLDICVSIDTSGSVGTPELKEFLTEMLAISNSFSQVKMTLIVCDAKVHEVHELNNANVDKLLSLKMSGGGGTTHVPVEAWITKNKPNAKLLIALTDGYTEIPKEMKTKTIWVITKNGTDDIVKNSGEVIKIC